jgi:hypothetical protein
MVQAFGLDLLSTRMLHLGTGFSSLIDALHHQLSSANLPLVITHNIMGRKRYFMNRVSIVHFELSGHMMQNRDFGLPCYDSELVRGFRDKLMDPQCVTPDVIDAWAIV